MSIISFIVESLICSGLFLVLYRWLLAKKVSFRLCRAYLTVTMVLSVTIPVMEVPIYPSEQIAALNEWTVFSFDDFTNATSDVPEAAVVGQAVETGNASVTEVTDEKRVRALDLKLILTILYILPSVASLSLIRLIPICLVL